MAFGFMFISLFSYALPVSNWANFSSAYYTGGGSDKTLTLISNITFGSSLTNPSWATFNIVGNTAGSMSIKLSGNNYQYGGFLLNGNKTLNFSGTLSFVRFLKNSGGAIFATNSGKINFNNSMIYFNSNNANSGGAIEIENRGQINFNSSAVNFNSNSANSGGAIYISNTSQITFNSGIVNFNSNSSNQNGGAIYLIYKGQINFSNSNVNFNSNRAGYYGGALYVINSGQINFISGVVDFNSNIAGINGGAIFNNQGIINFNSGVISFNSNSAELYGGAIYLGNMGKFTFSNSIVNFNSNSADKFGGAAYVYNEGQINFGNSIINFSSNSASQNGGAISALNAGQISFINSKVRFINNTAANNGGAIYLEYHSKIYLESGEFRGNKASGHPNDIDLYDGSTITFSPKQGQSIIMDGGISIISEGEPNYIEKIGSGELILISGAKIEMNGSIDIKAGSLILKDSAKIETSSPINITGGALILQNNSQVETSSAINITGGSLKSDSVNNKVTTQELNLSNNGVLDISIDYASGKASSISATALSIGQNAKLLINNIGIIPAKNEKIRLIYAGNTDMPNDFNSIDGIHHRYLFEWVGSANNWTGSLIYQWRIIQPAFYANLMTLGAIAESISDNNIFISQDNENQKVWVSYSFSGLIYKSNENSQEKFTTQSNGIRVGANIIKGWGAFAGYKGIKAKQDEDIADASDREIGIYKELKINEININGMISFGLQAIDVKEGASFNTKSIRLAVDANAPVFKFADLFGGLRGGYVIADDIKDNEIEMKSAGYMKLDILAGLKKDYAASSKVSLIGKAFLGLAAIGSEPEFDAYKIIDKKDIKAIGANEGSFFVSINGDVNYNLAPSIDLFAGLNAQFATVSTVNAGYWGVNYKF
jgi:predicted outer membrane repeat protein